MQRRRKWLLLIFGCAILSVGLLGITAYFHALKFAQLQAHGEAYKGLASARVAAFLWPTRLNRINYAQALYSGNRLEEHKMAKALVDTLDWRDADLPSMAYSLRAKGECENQRPDLALTTLQEGLSKYPNHEDLWFTMGQLRDLQERWNEALVAYGKASEIAKQKPAATFLLHEIFMRRVADAAALGDNALGMMIAQEASVAFPTEPRWLDYYADFAENAADYVAAADTWRRAIALSFSVPRLYAACRVFGKLRRPDYGEVFLQNATVSSFALHYCRAALYCYSSPSRARQELITAGETAGSDVQRLEVRMLLAASLTWIGKPKESNALLRKMQGMSDIRGYVELYVLQTEILIHPETGKISAQAYLRALRNSSSARSVVECLEIVSGRELRMPRHLIPS